MKPDKSYAQDEYSGVDNLEVMAAAKNYNKYLLGLASCYASHSDTIVDFGAGTGTFAVAMQSADYQVTCIELDRTLRDRLTKMGLSVYDTTSKLQPNSVDYIYSFNVLEHIEKDHEAVSSLEHILKPSGTLLLYVPAFQLLFSGMDSKVGHFRRYRKNHLVQLVEKNGFTVKRAEYVDSLGFIAALVYKILDKGDGQINNTSLLLFDKYIFPLSRLLDKIFKHWIGKNVLLVAYKN